MKQYIKNNISVCYDKKNKKIGFQFYEHDSMSFVEADDAVVIYVMLQSAIEDYFTDYPLKAGKL